MNKQEIDEYVSQRIEEISNFYHRMPETVTGYHELRVLLRNVLLEGAKQASRQEASRQEPLVLEARLEVHCENASCGAIQAVPLQLRERPANLRTPGDQAAELHKVITCSVCGYSRLIDLYVY